MKDVFFGHIPPTPEEFAVLWEDALIILDTNVLLNQYRYSEKTREEMFSVLEQVKDRLWMPYQVGWEFFNNRRSALTQNQRTAIKGLDGALKAISAAVRELKGRHVKPKELEALVQQAQTLRDTQEAQRLEILKEHGSDDPIMRRITALYEGRTGKEPTEKWLDERCTAAEPRMRKQVPPGYRDFNPKSGEDRRRKFGDYLLWVQVLERCKEQQKPFILVTGDVKEDWYRRESGQTVGPRPELLDEAKNQYGIDGWLYRGTSFLERAKQELGTGVSDEAIDEVERTEGKYIASINDLHEMFETSPLTQKRLLVSDVLKRLANETRTNTMYSNHIAESGYYVDYGDLNTSAQRAIRNAVHNNEGEERSKAIRQILHLIGYEPFEPPGPGEEWSPP